MSLYLSVGEIFDMGIQIEANGKKFYEAAAQNISDVSAQKLFLELSDWESKHIELFRKLKETLPSSLREEATFDPNQELDLYIKATAENHVFVKNRDVAKLAQKCKTAGEAFDVAVNFEKDSVVFYATMKKAVPEDFGRDKIDALIDEEIRHISILTQKKKEWEEEKWETGNRK